MAAKRRTQKSKPIRVKIYTSTFRQGSSYLGQVLVRHLHVCKCINELFFKKRFIHVAFSAHALFSKIDLSAMTTHFDVQDYINARFALLRTMLNYTMHNIFSNLLCFTSYFAHLVAATNNFNDNSQSTILGKWNHKLTDSIL